MLNLILIIGKLSTITSNSVVQQQQYSGSKTL